MRRILIAAVIVVVLAVVVVLTLRQSLQNGPLRTEAERRLTAMLGQPVSIGSVGLSFFPRIQVTGTGVRVGAMAEAPAVGIGTVHIRPRPWSLVSGPLAIDEILLDEMVVSVLRDRRGGWQAPVIVPAPGEGGGVSLARVRLANGRIRVFEQASDATLREAGSIDDLDAAIAMEGDGDGAGLRLDPLTGQIGGAELTGTGRSDADGLALEIALDRVDDGDVPRLLLLLATTRPDFLKLEEPASVSASLRIARADLSLTGRGTLRAPRVLLDGVRLEALDAPFALDGRTLVFDPTRFTMNGGAHTGRITIADAGRLATWTTDSRLRNLDIGAFLAALTGRDQNVGGTAALTATLRGRVGEALVDTVHGRAHVTVANGIVRNFPLLATINRTLRLTGQEGNDTQFESLTATLRIASGQSVTDDLVLRAGHIRVHASGRIGADRSLALSGRAVLSPERSAQAIGSIRELSGLRNRQGELELPLTIGGTADAPAIRIDTGAVVKKGVMDELQRQLRRLIKK